MSKDEQWLLEEKYGGQHTLAFEADKKRLAKGEPLAYVIGYQPFLGLKIYLDSKPLIPRPETEWWTEELLRAISKRQGEPLKFLDLCAGSGAVGCAILAQLPDARVYFGEIDPAHKTTIFKNIRENQLDESRAEIHIGDLFEPFGDILFDVIAANPPYIPSHRALPESVSKHEPAAALFAGDDGLEVIRRIAKELPEHLAIGGSAWIECDSGHVEIAERLFTKQGFAAQIRADQYGVRRITVV